MALTPKMIEGVLGGPRKARGPRKASKGARKAKLSDLGPPYSADQNRSIVPRQAGSVVPRQSTSVGAVRKAGAPATRGERQTLPRVRPTSSSRPEKFMGNAQVVPNDRLPAPPMRSAGNSRGRKAMAAGAVLGAVGITMAAGDRVESKPTASARPPLKAAGNTPSASASVKRSVTPSSAPQGGTRNPSSSPAPKTAPRASQRASGASTGSSTGGKLKGKALADYLGLGADSAVRTYMETGKHKYPSGKKK